LKVQNGSAPLLVDSLDITGVHWMRAQSDSGISDGLEEELARQEVAIRLIDLRVDDKDRVSVVKSLCILETKGTIVEMGVQNLEGPLRRSLGLLNTGVSSPAIAVVELISILDALTVDTAGGVFHLDSFFKRHFQITILVNHPLGSCRVSFHDLITNRLICGQKSHGSSLCFNRVRYRKSGGEPFPNMVELTPFHNVSCWLALVKSSIRKQVRFLLTWVSCVLIRQ
jgi:hypothetical protein